MAYYTYKSKKIYYEELGDGTPLLLLHGNTASSKMFSEITQQYMKDHKVVLIDFLGYGQSDHVNELSPDLWYDQAMQVITFLDVKGYERVNIIGTSGGAITAINIALERPDLINKVIADSFEGIQANPAVTASIIEGREMSKKNPGAQQFYEYMNGADWESVVDADTRAMVAHTKNIVQFFHKPLNELKTDLLLTGSREDEFFPGDYYDTLFSNILNQVEQGKKYIFNHGGHPAMMSNQEEFIQLSNLFFVK